MASNSFKVKNSLVLTPKDLSTLTNPEAGDLACDINDNNKIKRYDETLADWVEVGSGAGGGLDVFHTDSFDDIKNVSSFSTGNNASFLGGGTLAGGLSLESISPISGINSLKYTQASGSLNDYFASEIIDVDLKQQNNTSGMTLYFTYDGDANDGRFIVWDETNDQEISNQLALVETASKATRYSLSFHVPATCTQIRWGYQVLVENVGAVLLVDDVEMTTDPFVNVPQPSIQYISYVGNSGLSLSGSRIDFSAASITNTNNGIIVINNSSGHTRFTAVKPCSIRVSAAINQSIASNRSAILKNESVVGDSTPTYTAGFSTSSSAIVQMQVGDYISISSDSLATTRNSTLTIEAEALSDQILTPSDTFSTDTAPLTYAPSSQYTLSTLEDAPVGTFITFTYAANTNTRTQTTTAPSQSTADMNQNGIRMFARAYNASSTAANPAAVAIQIGKGLKGWSLKGYSSTNKSGDQLQADIFQSGSFTFGFRYKSYSELTGILILDAGVNLSSSTGAFFETAGLSSVPNGYWTINAGKTLPLLAIPTPQVAYLKDIKPSGTAGGTFTSGAWQTRTLNTVEGDGSIVSLNANQFVLQPGKYEIEASAPAFYVQANKLKLRNITDSSDVIIGQSTYSIEQSGFVAGNTASLKGRVILTSSKTFEIQHRSGATYSTGGFGQPSSFGVDEVYTICKITKLS